tara:strand:- start:1808 stop:2740 length:933 start_codon:yes stop_codon:yes gene_type:complete
MISVVIPVYHAQNIIEDLLKRLFTTLDRYHEKYEIILVDDASKDNSWNQISKLAVTKEQLKAIRFSRNFGQHNAITAGLNYSKGDFVIVMDCDLQHSPEYIPKLLEKIKQGFDVVYAKDSKRKHSIVRNFFARLFKNIFNWLSSDTETNLSYSSFTCLSRKVVDALLKINDQHRHYLLMLNWLGFPSSEVIIEHQPRHSGKSSYSYSKLVKHALNGISSQSVRLLYISITVGFIYLFTAIIYSSYLIFSYFNYGFKEGWTSLMVTVLFSTGFILLSLGITGVYLGKVFEQVKDRPLYIISETININKEKP